MYAMYYMLILQCWQLVRILVRTNHPCLRVGRYKCRVKRACMSRQEMPMQGMCEEEVILADTVIEICVVDVGGE
jgi:hypothetical protein